MIYEQIWLQSVCWHSCDANNLWQISSKFDFVCRNEFPISEYAAKYEKCRGIIASPRMFCR